VRNFLKKRHYPQPASATYERLVETQFEVIPRAEYAILEAGCNKRLRDKNDGHVLAAFESSEVDFLVSGDKDLLSLADRKIIPAGKALQIMDEDKQTPK